MAPSRDEGTPHLCKEESTFTFLLTLATEGWQTWQLQRCFLPACLRERLAWGQVCPELGWR